MSRQLMAELSHKRFDNEFEDFETSDEIVNLQNAPVDKQRHFLRIFCVAYMLATASLIAFGDVSRYVPIFAFAERVSLRAQMYQP